MLAELVGCAGEPPPVALERVVIPAPPQQVAGPPDPEAEARDWAERQAKLAAKARRPSRPGCAGEKHLCKGMNDCKGIGGCKTDRNDCKGKNDCKGQGGCKTADCGRGEPVD